MTTLIKTIFLFWLILFPAYYSSQTTDFSAIDKHAINAPSNVSANIETLFSYLMKPTKNDLEKVRSFYVWISCNIKYDMKSLLANKYPPYDAETVLKNKSAVCIGYAKLFEALCKKAKIPVYIVDGYSKGFGYIDGQNFTIPDHAWNSVKINNKWYILDVTWDGTSTNLPESFPTRKFNSKYFLASPQAFSKYHLPSDPIWQLSDSILTISDFENSNAIKASVSSQKKNNFSFNDSINVFQKYDTIDALLGYSRRALDFNPSNYEARILYAIAYFQKGYQVFNDIKKISAKEYDKRYMEYDAKINYYYSKSYDVLESVKPYMKFYDEAKEYAEIIMRYKVNSDMNKTTTSNVNYKTNKNFKTRMLDKSMKCDIKKMDVLNSPFRETNLNISPDGNLIFFMSDRGGQPWSVQRTNQFRGKSSFDGDLWYAKKQNGHFVKPTVLDNTVNTSSGEDEPNISPDGQKIVYQSWMNNWMSNGGPYYIADLNGNKCQNITGLGDGISRFFIHTSSSSKAGNAFGTDGATMSPNGKRFIISCGSNYGKDLDIYMSEKDKFGKWSLLEPLKLNTLKDERSVFLAADGVTLFFASDGYGGLGGLDMYKTTIDENGKIGEIINLGNKFNTKGDDYGFIIDASGTNAYFIRDGDIYEAIFKVPLLEITPGKSIVIKGKISHNFDTKLVFKVKVEDENSKAEMSSTLTNDSSGRYYLLLKSIKQTYKISVYNGSIKMAEAIVQADTLKNYSEYIKNFTIKVNKNMLVNDSSVNVIRIREDKYEKGTFARVNFGYDSYILSQNYYSQLKTIVDYMKKNKNAKLGIAGYSDIRGTNQYNQKLSQKRAEVVYEYLLKSGVDKSQLIQSYYGAQNPLTLDQTIQGGWVNRRVEFMIVNGFPE